MSSFRFEFRSEEFFGTAKFGPNTYIFTNPDTKNVPSGGEILGRGIALQSGAEVVVQTEFEEYSGSLNVAKPLSRLVGPLTIEGQEVGLDLGYYYLDWTRLSAYEGFQIEFTGRPDLGRMNAAAFTQFTSGGLLARLHIGAPARNGFSGFLEGRYGLYDEIFGEFQFDEDVQFYGARGAGSYRLYPFDDGVLGNLYVQAGGEIGLMAFAGTDVVNYLDGTVEREDVFSYDVIYKVSVRTGITF